MLPRSPRWRGAGGSGCRFTKEKSGLCHRPEKKTPPLRPSHRVGVNGGGFRSLVQVGFFSTPGHATALERSGRATKRSDWRDKCSRTGDKARNPSEKCLLTLQPMGTDNRDWYRDWWRRKTGYVERAAFRVGDGERKRAQHSSAWRRNAYLVLGFIVFLVALAVLG